MKTTFDELGKSAALFIPIAAQLGVGLDEVLGMMASITRVGVPTSAAATQLSRVMIELADSTSGAGEKFTELTGKSFPQFVAEGGNLTQALKILKIGADDAGVELLTMFGRAEAGKAAVVLMKDNADDLAESIESVGDSAGATEKANKIATSNVADEWTKLKTSIVNNMLSITKANDGLVYNFLKNINIVNKARTEEQTKSDAAEETLYKRRDQLQAKYVALGISKNKAYFRAVRESAEEIGRLGTAGVDKLVTKDIKTAPKSQSTEIKEEQEQIRKDRKAAAKKLLDDQVIADNLANGKNKTKVATTKKVVDTAAKEAAAARKAETDANKAFSEGLQIESSKFNSEQLTEKSNFIKNQTKLIEESNTSTAQLENEAVAFEKAQLLEADQQKIDELTKTANYYKGKKEYKLEYNKALEEISKAELKLLEDSAEEKKTFIEEREIEEAEFTTKQLTDQFNFMQSQAELKESGQITDEEFAENAKNFLQEQLLEADRQQIEELQQLADYYNEKEGYQQEYIETMGKLKTAEMKILEDGTTEKGKELAKRKEFDDKYGDSIKTTYSDLLEIDGNFLEGMQKLAAKKLAAKMLEYGEEKAVDGVYEIATGTGRLLKSYGTDATGYGLIANGVKDLALAAAWGAASKSLSNYASSDSSSSGSSSDDTTSTTTTTTTDTLDEVETKPTITYMMPDNSTLLDVLIPSLNEKLKDGHNVTIIKS